MRRQKLWMYGRFYLTILLVLAMVTSFPVPAGYAAEAEIGTLELVVVSPNQIRAEWKGTLVSGYVFKLEKKVDGGNFSEILTYGYSSALNQYADTFVSPGHTYTYRVRLVTSSGTTVSQTNEASAAATDVAAPLSLQVKSVSQTQIDLSWTYPGGKSYDTVVERRLNGGAWTVIASVGKDKSDYSDSGLPANTSYFYRVKAVAGSYVSSPYFPDNGTGIESGTKLEPPSDVYGFAASNTQIYIAWTYNPGGVLYHIERRAGDSGEFMEVAAVPSNAMYHLDTGLAPNTRYVYRIKAESSGGINTSSYTPEFSVTSTQLEVPTGMTATATSNSAVELKWIDNSSTETGFEVWRKAGDAGRWEKLAAVRRNSTAYTDEEAVPDTRYYYKVRASIYYKHVYSAFTNEAATWSLTPLPPTELRYAVTSTSGITLMWKDNAYNESGYHIERKTGIEGAWAKIGTAAANATSFTVHGLTPYVQYFYRVSAFDNTYYNSSAVSGEIEVMTGLPKAPSDLKVQALSSGIIRLDWKDNAINESGFRIERKVKGSLYRPLTQAAADTTTFTDRSVEPGRIYYYRIRAVNNVGVSPYASEAYAQTKNGVVFKDVTQGHWAKTEIEDMASRGVFRLRTDGRFLPEGEVTRGEFTAILVKALHINNTAVGSLKDVTARHPYYREIMTAVRAGIISTGKDRYFFPDQLITREEIADLVVRAMKLIDKPLPSHDITILEEFPDQEDIAPGSRGNMAAMRGEGIIDGIMQDGRRVIAPKAPATRAQAAVIVYNAVNR